jgi:tetratricopeptide (TPR) repeat protein
MAGREDIFQKAMNDGHSAAWDQEWDKAALAYQKALAEFPDNPKALGSLGLALFQLQKYDDALKTYIRAAQAAPTDPVPYEKVALIYERQGNLNGAIQASIQAGEMYLRAREVEKSVENWLRVVQLNPEHIQARSRLAMIHEKIGQIHQAVHEYVALASIMQNTANPQKAMEMLQHASMLLPSSAEVVQALAMVKAGKMLPKPTRPKGGTGPLRMAQVKQLETPVSGQQIQDSQDPITEARKKALSVLADVLFDLTDDSSEAQTRRGLQSIMRGTGGLPQQSEQTKVLLHLSTSIDAQTKNNETLAADELELAIESGLNHPAGYFNLGLMRLEANSKLEIALRYLQQCNKHADYALGAHISAGQALVKMGRMQEAAEEYLEALKLADTSVVTVDQADTLSQLYEPLVESVERETDTVALGKLCANIQEMLVRVNWRQHLLKMRNEMPKSEGGELLPLAEILIQAQSGQVLEAMNHVNQLARANHLRSAMDEALFALNYAPTYLPLHTLMGELLIRDGRTTDAITKFAVIAQTYSVRGEGAQATKLFKRIIQLSPMDLSARTRLIEQLTMRGQVDEAISEYIDLADIYYRLAELDMARKTYTTALRMAQQPNTAGGWSVRILQAMADIDMQRLDWRQALRVYEQIRTQKPGDASVRQNLIELNMRMGQIQQAQSEIESFITHLESNRQGAEAISFLEKMVEEHGEQVILRRALAEQYFKAGKLSDAVTQLDSAGDILMQAGNRPGAVEIINRIIYMNPPNVEDYRQLLVQLQAG